MNLQCVDPKCDRKIPDEEVLKLVNDEEIAKKFRRFKRNALLALDKKVIFCCKPNCDGYYYNEKRFYHLCAKLHCNACDTRMCWKCKQPFHGYFLPCNQNDILYYKWALLRDIQQCPKCRVKIEKISGYVCTNINDMY